MKLSQLVPSGDVMVIDGEHSTGALHWLDYGDDDGHVNFGKVEAETWNLDEEWTEQERKLLHAW